MQFLHEEFFGKTYKYIKSINIISIRIIAKLLFWIIILGILGLLAWLYATGKQKWVFYIVGAFLIGEIAHILRKSRERKISMSQEESSNISDQLADADLIKKQKKVKKKKALNDELLKKSKKVKITKKKVLNKGGLLKR
tara:strand:- start:1046 stop:1462 length:417 start_codon:yes stop_codon:yes gene_type:complete